jgi:transcriptional repressor NrdR
MVCPKCLHAKTRIYNSRAVKRTNQTWRRRRCDNCGFEFSTREYVESGDSLQVTTNGKLLPFSQIKLLLSLARATEHYKKPDIAMYLMAIIENKLLHNSEKGVISVQDVLQATLKTLHSFDTQSFVAYLAAHPQMQDSRDLQNLLKSLR